MLKAGLHLLFSSLGVLTLWILDVPFFSGAWIRFFCSTGFGFAAFFLMGGYFWLTKQPSYRRHTSEPSHVSIPWDDPEELTPFYNRR